MYYRCGTTDHVEMKMKLSSILGTRSRDYGIGTIQITRCQEQLESLESIFKASFSVHQLIPKKC